MHHEEGQKDVDDIGRHSGNHSCFVHRFQDCVLFRRTEPEGPEERAPSPKSIRRRSPTENTRARIKSFPLDVEVLVSVRSGRIGRVDILKHVNGQGKGAEALPARVVEKPRPEPRRGFRRHVQQQSHAESDRERAGPRFESIMPSDAHAHPYDLIQQYPEAELERAAFGVVCLREFLERGGVSFSRTTFSCGSGCRRTSDGAQLRLPSAAALWRQ